jgi:CBS domain-containing protein
MRNNCADTLNALKISEVMSRKVISVYENTTIDKIEKIFKENEINHIPVIDENLNLKGVVSYSDIMMIKKMRFSSTSKSNVHPQYNNDSVKLVSDIMTKNPVTVYPQDLVGKAAEIFIENNFKCLPVVDSDNKVLGMITTYDLIVLAFTDIHQNIIY